MGCLSDPRGLPAGNLECPWVARGQSGVSVGCPWAVRGQSAGFLWLTTGSYRLVGSELPMGCPWDARGMPVGCSWDARGNAHAMNSK